MDYGRRALLRRCGDVSQLLGAREYRLEGGRAQGLRAADLRSGAGLELTVLADRGMDIAWLSCGGRNFSYMGSPGAVAPSFYDDRGLGWLRSFGAGFLTTCGLRNVGGPCSEDGEDFGLHGRESNAPAEELSFSVDWDRDEPAITAKGRMREARFFGENLELKRSLTVPVGRNLVRIEDRLTNLGFREEAFDILYHFNLGYPLLDASSRVLAPSAEQRPRDESMRPGLGRWSRAEPPTPGWAEEVFYHELRGGPEGGTCVALVNEAQGLGVALRFDLRELPNFTQWKMMGEGEYVMGLEPCNCLAEGRARTREAGMLERLAAGEERTFGIEAEFLTDREGIERVAAEIAALE